MIFRDTHISSAVSKRSGTVTSERIMVQLSHGFSGSRCFLAYVRYASVQAAAGSGQTATELTRYFVATQCQKQ